MFQRHKLHWILFTAALAAGCSTNDVAVRQERPATAQATPNAEPATPAKPQQPKATAPVAKAEPAPKSAEPAPAPATEPAPVARTEPAAKPTPRAKSEPAPAPVKAQPKPAPIAKAEPKPAPAAKAEPAPRPKQTVKSEPKPAAKPAPESKPAVAAKPEPAPGPVITSTLPSEIVAFIKADLAAVKSMDAGRVMKNYHPDFRSDGRDFATQESLFFVYGPRFAEKWDIDLKQVKIEDDIVTVLKGSGTTNYGTANMAGTKIVKKDGRWVWLGNGK